MRSGRREAKRLMIKNLFGVRLNVNIGKKSTNQTQKKDCLSAKQQPVRFLL
jgi:hypothetical protein